MKRLYSFSAMAAVVLAGIFVTSCAPPAPARTSSYRPTTTYVKKPVVRINNRSYRSIVVGVRGPETRMISVPAVQAALSCCAQVSTSTLQLHATHAPSPDTNRFLQTADTPGISG